VGKDGYSRQKSLGFCSGQTVPARVPERPGIERCYAKQGGIRNEAYQRSSHEGVAVFSGTRDGGIKPKNLSIEAEYHQHGTMQRDIMHDTAALRYKASGCVTACVMAQWLLRCLQ